MLFRRATLDQIARGEVDLAFRRWTRPQARAGGSQRTAIGVLAVDAVDIVAEESLTEADARASGFADLAALKAMLREKPEGDVYRIRLRFAGADPREALRQQLDDIPTLVARLDRLDRSASAPWTREVLALIGRQPGTRAADLASVRGEETLAFKRNVRKLKELGLTESLEIGYRLSPRGLALLDSLAGS